MTLIFGLITGILFGFVLQRSGILTYEKQVGALRFIDMTMFKINLKGDKSGIVQKQNPPPGRAVKNRTDLTLTCR